MTTRPPPYAMSAEDAAEYCGISVATLRRLVDDGLAPAPVHIPTRAGKSKRPPSVWLRPRLEEWLDGLDGRAPDAGPGGMTRRADRNALRPDHTRSR